MFDTLGHTNFSLGGSGFVAPMLRLEVPESIGGRVYGLKSIELCRPGSNGTITAVNVVEALPLRQQHGDQ